MKKKQFLYHFFNHFFVVVEILKGRKKNHFRQFPPPPPSLCILWVPIFPLIYSGVTYHEREEEKEKWRNFGLEHLAAATHTDAYKYK